MVPLRGHSCIMITQHPYQFNLSSLVQKGTRGLSPEHGVDTADPRTSALYHPTESPQHRVLKTKMWTHGVVGGGHLSTLGPQ